MWLVHSSGEEGWYIPQTNQQEPCDRLVFVRTSENGWKVKLWKNTQTRIRAKNQEEELQDMAAIRSAGFLLGCAQIQPQAPEQEQTQPEAPAQEQTQSEPQAQSELQAQEQTHSEAQTQEQTQAQTQEQPQTQTQEQERTGIWYRISSAVSTLRRLVGLNR